MTKFNETEKSRIINALINTPGNAELEQFRYCPDNSPISFENFELIDELERETETHVIETVKTFQYSDNNYDFYLLIFYLENEHEYIIKTEIPDVAAFENDGWK